MQSNVVMERFFDNLSNEESDFEIQVKAPRQAPQRSKKEQVIVRRRVEEVLAEKRRMQLLCQPYAEL